MSDLPIYSPTETDDYLLCPRLRVLKRAWRPRGGTWRPHMTLGNAVHEGLATHYGGRYPDPARQAEALADALIVLEREFVEGSEWTLEGLKKLVEKALKTALTTELVSPDGRVVDVEQWAAHCKIDLVTREPFGLVVTDHKVSLELEKRRLEYKVREADPSWQLLHEAWAVREKYGECPKWARAHFIAIGPRAFTHIHSIGPLDDKRLDDWAASAEEHWSRMKWQGDHFAVTPALLPPMNTRSCWQYNRKCDFYELCHVYGGDLTQAPALYEEGGRE